MINLIELGFDPGATERPVGGTRKKFGIINFEDLDFSAGSPFTLDGDGKITAIAMKATKVMYEYTGFRTDLKKSDEVITMGLGPNQFKHAASYVICDRTQVQKNSIEQHCRGKVLIFAENLGADADAFELLGAKSGLELVPGSIRNAHENGGYFTLSVATLEGEFESKLPQTVGTTYADGLTLFDALVAG